MYSIKLIPPFQKNIKKLSKKYPNVYKDCLPLLDQLEQGIFIGDRLQGFSHNVFQSPHKILRSKKRVASKPPY